MNNKLNQFLLSFVLVLVASFCSFVIAFAGNLTPPAGSPSPTMFSLEQIYNSLAGTGYDSSGFSPNADGNIQEQLKYIAGLIDPRAVLGSMFNGGNSTWPGGSQANGGTDDCNLSGDVGLQCSTAPAGTYQADWITCNSGNSWCGLGVNGENVAKAMDNNTGLVWSYPCSGVNCANMTNETADNYDHDTALVNCISGAHGKSGWHLPHQKQLMMAYIDGSFGNLVPTNETFAAPRFYWSATETVSEAGDFAWRTNLARGTTDWRSIFETYRVRCVQLAP